MGPKHLGPQICFFFKLYFYVYKVVLISSSENISRQKNKVDGKPKQTKHKMGNLHTSKIKLWILSKYKKYDIYVTQILVAITTKICYSDCICH